MSLKVLASHATALAGALLLAAGAVHAQKKYDPGVTDTEITIGQTNPYSGPSYSTQGRCRRVLQHDHRARRVNGRKIKFFSLDDGYQPPKTVEQTRKLVEDDQVLAIVGSMGTPTNTAIVKYMNAKKVPHIMLASGASKWGNPKDNPWTMGWYPTYFTEGVIYGKYIVKNIKDAKIGILYQNDDYGKDFVNGLKQGLGDQAGKLIVKEVSYEVTDPTVDSQIVTLGIRRERLPAPPPTRSLPRPSARPSISTGIRPSSWSITRRRSRRC
jgi:ABC-type branched-subunit amino acid transport system substrate-binding protein